MRIPDKFYVGFRSDGADDLIAFFTPDDGDANTKKRKITVDNWCGKNLKAVTIDNTPQTGFRIVDTARRFRSDNVLFRILHPEIGAEFEISAENLNELHQQSIIEYGEIKNTLIMAREGQHNYLLVEDSPKHKEILASMKKEEDKQKKIASISKKDVKEFDKVKLVSSYSDYVYLGRLNISLYGKNYNNRHVRNYTREHFSTENAMYVFATENTLKVYKTFPKIEKIIAASGKTTADFLDVKNVSLNRDYYTNVQGLTLEQTTASDFEYTMIPSGTLGELKTSSDIEEAHIQRSPGVYSPLFVDHKYQPHYTRIFVIKNAYSISGMTKTGVTLHGHNRYGSSIEITDDSTEIFQLKIKRK